MLPDWFDLHVLRLTVSIAAVVCVLLAVLAVARFRRPLLRAGLAVVLLAGASALVVYDHGPLQHAEDNCSYRFMKSDLAVDGCAVATGAASSANQ